MEEDANDRNVGFGGTELTALSFYGGVRIYQLFPHPQRETTHIYPRTPETSWRHVKIHLGKERE